MGRHACVEGLVKTVFIFGTATFPARLASTIAETKEGLVAGGFGGTAERNPDVCIWMSRSIAGRWTLPRRFFSLVYKGDGLLDLRAAQLTAAETVITAVSYKSRTEILLPAGVRLELGGTGVSATGDMHAPEPPQDAPVVRVKGVAYKGSIEVRVAGPGAAA